MKKYLTLGIVVLGILFGAYKCMPEREFKASGVITESNPDGVVVKTLVPSAIRKSERSCLVIAKDKEVKCEESMGDLTFTHTLNGRSLDMDSIKIGDTLKDVRLPIVRPMDLEVPSRLLMMGTYEDEVGTNVFINGVYINKDDVRVKAVYRSKDLTNNPVSTNTGSVKVCVPPVMREGQERSFFLYSKVGENVNVYELMHPNVEVADSLSNDVLQNEPSSFVILLMSSDLKEVKGSSVIEGVHSLSECYNSGLTQIPPHKGLVDTFSLSQTEKKVVRSPRRSNGIDVDWAAVFSMFIAVIATLYIMSLIT